MGLSRTELKIEKVDGNIMSIQFTQDIPYRYFSYQWQDLAMLSAQARMEIFSVALGIVTKAELIEERRSINQQLILRKGGDPYVRRNKG